MSIPNQKTDQRKKTKMPRLKADDVAFDIDELEEAEYSDEFEDYTGPIPPKGTVLIACIKKMWWTDTQKGDDMIKILAEADGNEGDLEKYNGLPLWENAVLIPSAKFRWKPFIDNFGITLRDIKTKTVVAKEDDRMGAPIDKIGTFEPGSDDAWCRVLTARTKDPNDEWRAEVKKWLPYEDPESQAPDDEPDDDEEEEEEGDDEELEEEEVEDDEEPDDEPEPPVVPARRRAAPAKASGAAKPAAARTASRAANPAAATPARSAATRARTARSAPAKAATSAASKRGRRAAAAPADEPPF
jgi:hypothetical protein